MDFELIAEVNEVFKKYFDKLKEKSETLLELEDELEKLIKHISWRYPKLACAAEESKEKYLKEIKSDMQLRK